MTPTVDYHNGFDDSPEHATAYFILDESRHEPPEERAEIIAKTSCFFPFGSPIRAELYQLACDLADCSQAAARVLAGIRSQNAKILNNDTALRFFLDRLESKSLNTQFALSTYGQLTIGDDEAVHDAWAEAWSQCQSFERRFDLFLHRLRGRHWFSSNAEVLHEMRAANGAKKAPASAA